MVVDKNNYMSSYQEKLSKSAPSFDRKNLSAILIIAFGMVLMGGYGASQVASGYDVSIGQNGIEMGTGTLDVMGNDIESSGTTVFDGSAGQIATSVVDYSAATASDVGLGNVENIALSGATGSFLTWDSTNNEFEVDGASIQSGTSASDVGLGNVQNEAQVAESGDTMTGDLSFTDDSLIKTSQSSGNYIEIDTGNGNFEIKAEGSTSDVNIKSDDDIFLRTEDSGTSYDCELEETGDWVCDGSKSWVHDLGNGSEAVYTSQESPEVRAVYEGKAHIEGSKRIELPSHFSKTVSDKKPMLRAQVTPQGTFTKAVVMDKTDDYIEIKVGKETDVNFRITGVREGYEDKQVVRPKEE